MERACRKVKAAIFLAGGIKQEVGSSPITSAFTKLYYSRASSHWLTLEILGQNHKGLSSVKRVKRNSGSEGGRGRDVSRFVQFPHYLLARTKYKALVLG